MGRAADGPDENVNLVLRSWFHERPEYPIRTHDVIYYWFRAALLRHYESTTPPGRPVRLPMTQLDTNTHNCSCDLSNDEEWGFNCTCEVEEALVEQF